MSENGNGWSGGQEMEIMASGQEMKVMVGSQEMEIDGQEVRRSEGILGNGNYGKWSEGMGKIAMMANVNNFLGVFHLKIFFLICDLV